MEIAISSTDMESVLLQFTDRAAVDDWAKQATAIAVKYKIVNGSKEGLQPKNNITRAEVAAIIQRLLNNNGLMN